MQIISRADARAQGLKQYFTGKPCKHGHVELRRTDNGSCLQCRSDAYWKNRDSFLSACRARYRKDPQKVRSRARRYRQENKDAENAARRKKYRNNLGYRIKCKMHDLLARSLRASDGSKMKRTTEHLGYTPDQLRDHIERQFAKGMSWDNWGEWHIDHITPIKWFIDQGIKDPAQINCLSNLRPVWAGENLRKNDRRTNLL